MAGLLSTSIAAAVTREGLRNQMETSMFGRRAGMDFNGYEVGEQDTRLPIDLIATTAAGQTLSPNGFSLLASSTGSTTFNVDLTQAIPGIYKQITQISSSSGGTLVRFGPNAQIISSLGSSFNAILFQGLGHTANLSCISSGSSLGSSVGGGGTWLICTVFTTAGGMTATTY